MGKNKESNSEIEKLSFITKGVGYTIINKKNEEEHKIDIATKLNICNDMVDLFSSEDFSNKDKIWCDIYCKTGNTAKALLNRGVNKDRIILICDKEQSQLFACRQLYGKLLESIDVNTDIESLKHYKITRRGQVYCIKYLTDNINWEKAVCNGNDAFNIIKFVIGKEYNKSMGLEWKDTNDFNISNILTNPPYNNDIYLDFIQLAHTIAKDNVVAITPAKWQAKSDAKNIIFRENIIPYIKKVVFYKDSTDVFEIEEWGGISYYILDNSIHNSKQVKTVCSRNNKINSSFEDHDEINLNLYNRDILNLIGKVGTLGDGFRQSKYIKNIKYEEKTLESSLSFKRLVFVGEQERGTKECTTDCVEVMQGEKLVGYKKKSELRTELNLDKYKCICSIMPGAVSAFDTDGKVLGMFKISIIGPNQVPKGSFPILRYFDTEDECKSFVSYCNTRLIAFLFYIGVCGTTLTKEFFRFVPDPGKFDHIFTDEELYKKYNLTPEEIEIIESVIKERS